MSISAMAGAVQTPASFIDFDRVPSSTPRAPPCIRPGILGGGQVGYNWQSGNWVTGFEADIQGTGQRGSGTIFCPAGVCAVLPVTASITEKLDWFGTVRGRLGWTVTPEMMIYATGGLAYGELNDGGSITDGVTTYRLHFK